MNEFPKIKSIKWCKIINCIVIVLIILFSFMTNANAVIDWDNFGRNSTVVNSSEVIDWDNFGGKGDTPEKKAQMDKELKELVSKYNQTTLANNQTILNESENEMHNSQNNAIDTTDIITIALIIIMVLVVILIIITVQNNRKENQNEELIQTNKTSLTAKILIAIYGIAAVGFGIMSSVIYIYTIYYYAVNSGFGGAILSFILPGFSSIYLFINLLISEGFFNNFTTMIAIWLICIGIIAIPTIFSKD